MSNDQKTPDSATIGAPARPSRGEAEEAVRTLANT